MRGAGPTPRGAAKRLGPLRCLALAAAVSACASVPAEFRVREELARGRYREAAEAAGRQGDELLRHLDRALALRHAGDGRASNLHFARAEHLSEERYTRSLGRAALSLLLNDTVLPYQPDPWERLLVPLYRGLNHVAAGEPQDAAVEARRLAALLLARRDADAARAVEEGDAFLSVLAGLLFEWAGAPDDARVAYRNAAESYGDTPVPWLVGAGPSSAGELVLLVERGFIAAPVEEKILLFLDGEDLRRARADADAAAREVAKRWLEGRLRGESGGDRGLGYLLAFALRTRPAIPEPPARVTLEVEGRALDVQPGLDLSRAASRTYARDLPGLLAKTAARAIAKTLAFKETTDGEGPIVRAIANVLHVATEQADLRAWLSLPAEMRLLRLPLAPGRYDLRVRFDAPGGSRTLELRGVEVASGRPTLVAARGP